MPTIHELPTPALLLDLDVLEANLERMARRAEELGVALRPHLKTHKCVEIAQRQRALGAGGVTVSTLPEARAFVAHGFDDVTWAFPLVLSRLDEVRALSTRATLRLVVDSREAVDAVIRLGVPLHIWLKVDCGYHRAGVDPSGELVVTLARAIDTAPTLTFDGILSHSGHAYRGPTRREVLAAAIEERDTMVRCAERLRAAGIAVPAVSVGSTPSMAVIDHLDGVDEARPGNYAFYDHTQVLLGSCAVRDCAVTVLASVVSCQPGGDHGVTDAGALALSKDRGRHDAPQQTMGELFDDYAAGRLQPEARLVSLSQEHGVINAPRPVGSRVRILPNHSCLTVACFDAYDVVRGEQVVDRWLIHRER
ncbi:MAG: alanine racemase [Gemmatimonadota bacterium]|nr:alanine racemase [Gemmatimonadota bacterium]MDH3477395.1 alanine racemase [Gemmatimonadota bacterium]MDH3569291.1 alanine racemase [Gemmatimonadota bacterium]MDH5548766.1 alanine racemase [Gemmatimonadota bacterium]